MTLESIQPRTEIRLGIFLGLRGGSRVRQTTLPSSVTELSRKGESLVVSHTYGFPPPVTGIALSRLSRKYGSLDVSQRFGPPRPFAERALPIFSL
jgi:hypothetical protein